MTKKSRPMMKRSLGQTKIFFAIFAIFGTFGRYVTNPRGTFVENVKKSPKSAHPTLGTISDEYRNSGCATIWI
jgi:hypothetical protein